MDFLPSVLLRHLFQQILKPLDEVIGQLTICAFFFLSWDCVWFVVIGAQGSGNYATALLQGPTWIEPDRPGVTLGGFCLHHLHLPKERPTWQDSDHVPYKWHGLLSSHTVTLIRPSHQQHYSQYVLHKRWSLCGHVHECVTRSTSRRDLPQQGYSWLCGVRNWHTLSLFSSHGYVLTSPCILSPPELHTTATQGPRNLGSLSEATL